MKPVAERLGASADPRGHVPVWRTPNRAVFGQPPQVLESSAHYLETILPLFEKGVEQQGQVPAVPDYALQRRGQRIPKAGWDKRLP